MAAYRVVLQDGFGHETSKSPLIHATEASAMKELEKLIDRGEGGAQDYALPEGEEYWDSVGYSYLEVVKINKGK
jgi:hypothetical protein